MLDYEKKLKYFDYLENGEKKRTAGFVKIERKGEYCDIQVSVNGVGGTSSLDREIRLEFGQREETLGSLSIREGKGNLVLKHLHREKLCGTSENLSSYEALTGIRIFMGKEKELYCAWEEAAPETFPKRKAEEAAVEEDIEEKNIVGRNAVEENTEGKNTVENSILEKDIVEKNMTEGDAIEKRIVGMSIKEDTDTKDIMAEYKVAEECKPGQVFNISRMEAAEQKQELREMQEKEEWGEGQKLQGVKQEQREGEQEAKTEPVQGQKQEPESLEEGQEQREVPQVQVIGEQQKQMPEVKEADEIGQKISSNMNRTDNKGRKNGLAYSKWQQLWYLYPHRIPFHDEREYLSVRPEDFVILSSRSYKLVNNSFLLHGFFNYDYLLLGRMEKDGKEKFYIGVPGNFYEREKQVALMFGFESFECQKEPAQVGDFGYYMIPVEL